MGEVIRARGRAVAVGEMRIPEVEWADWHLSDHTGEGEEEKGAGGVEGGREDGGAIVETAQQEEKQV